MAKVIIDLLEQAKSLLEDIKENTTPSAGSGLKSISISPVIETTPALDSLFPIYYDDLTEEEKQSVVVLRTTSDDFSTEGTYNVTITPTPNWYVYNPDNETFGGKGESVTFENVNGEQLTTQLVFILANETNIPPAEYVRVHISIE